MRSAARLPGRLYALILPLIYPGPLNHLSKEIK
jgi:hypothetical protein